ncbi:hypothetical protein OHA21_17710 [Actinoplanes sp. NBC_00393]|uniref:hypothetical protein n=1 Tax=Actinoplanes sp. NBC_00393 TaxID=2975953 RepID=UPI002E230BB7
MREIRILVIGSPGILRDVIVQLIGRCADMRIVDVAADPAAAAIWPAAADVVLCDLDDAERILRPCHLKVIALGDDGRRAALWELRAHRTEVGGMSPSQLVEMIRGRLE